MVIGVRSITEGWVEVDMVLSRRVDREDSGRDNIDIYFEYLLPSLQQLKECERIW
jgi:hypothetical protein